MDTPIKAMADYDGLLGQAADDISKEAWNSAKAALDKAITIDPIQVKAYEMLATVYDGMHDPDQADHYRTQAKAIRKEQWERQVEADIRGKHDLLGG